MLSRVDVVVVVIVVVVLAFVASQSFGVSWPRRQALASICYYCRVAVAVVVLVGKRICLSGIIFGF